MSDDYVCSVSCLQPLPAQQSYTSRLDKREGKSSVQRGSSESQKSDKTSSFPSGQFASRSVTKVVGELFLIGQLQRITEDTAANMITAKDRKSNRGTHR